MKKVFLKDIAKKLNVSIATVSLALNGNIKSGRISEELILKIKQTAIEMDYHPNIIARSLQSGRSFILGLIVADISNPFFGSLALSIQEYAYQKGYSVIIANSNEQTSKLQKSIINLKGYSVDGLIIVPTDSCEEALSPLINNGFPLVLVDRYLPEIEASHVVVDNFEAAYKINRILTKSGCRRIALIIYDNAQTHMIERLNGYKKALIEAECFDEKLVKKINYLNINEDICVAINELIDLPDTIDGIFFASNSLAQCGLSTLYNNTISPFEHIKICSFDKQEVFDIIPHKINYVKQPIDELGRQSVELVIHQIEGSKEVKKIRLPCSIQN